MSCVDGLEPHEDKPHEDGWPDIGTNGWGGGGTDATIDDSASAGSGLLACTRHAYSWGSEGAQYLCFLRE